jgi:hypothetical protein
MAQKWIERQIDDALLATAVSAGFLYGRRRVRRVVRRVERGAVVLGVGAVLAGIIVVGVGAGAVARSRRRAADAYD